MTNIVKRAIGILCIVLTINFWASAQTETSVFMLPKEKGVVYNKEFNVDIRLNTDGFALGLSKGKIKTYYKTNSTYFDFAVHRHAREFRQNNKVIFPATGETSSTFVYAKQNSFYSLKVGKSLKKYWSDKASRRGVMVGYVLEGGVSLGVLQPYFIKVSALDEETGLIGLKEVRYDTETRDLFLNESRIFGRSHIMKGLFSSDIIPGIHAQTGIHCDFGRYDNFIKALEVGLMVNVFTKKIELMVDQPAKPYLINFYLALQFGRRS